MPRPMRSLPIGGGVDARGELARPGQQRVEAVVESRGAEAELTGGAGELSGAGGGLRNALVQLPASRRDAPEPDRRAG